MQMHNRTATTEGKAYRFGFNGQEKDDEVSGAGNSMTAEFWQYDSRLGRRWNKDPVIKYQESPYLCFSNNPILLVDQIGADTALYDDLSGQLIATKEGDNEKTPIYVVNTRDENYDPENPWNSAKPLRYEVGKNTDRKGITGNSFRDNHPLKGVGTDAGAIVYKEDLLDLGSEFYELVDNGLKDFAMIKELWGWVRNYNMYKMVNDDGKYDLKSTIVSDGTPSYAAIVIGEWSLLNGTLMRYDDYGNFAYGIFGREAGYSKKELLERSNDNQKSKDRKGVTNGDGDDARDRKWIRIGFEFHKIHKWKSKKK